MIIAIDESGDAGKKFWRGSSPWLLMAAVVVEDEHQRTVKDAIASFLQAQRFHDELHFAHNPPEIHRAFLEWMHGQPFTFTCLAIRKQPLLRRKPWLFRSRLALYSYALDRLFQAMQPTLDAPVVYMDRNGGRWFTKAISRQLLHRHGSRHKGDRHGIAAIYTVESLDNRLIQLADYVAGVSSHFIQNYSDADLYDQWLRSKGVIVFDGDTAAQHQRA